MKNLLHRIIIPLKRSIYFIFCHFLFIILFVSDVYSQNFTLSDNFKDITYNIRGNISSGQSSGSRPLLQGMKKNGNISSGQSSRSRPLDFIIEIEGLIPEKLLDSNLTIELTPIINYSIDNIFIKEKVLQSITLKSEKINGQGNMPQYKIGGKFFQNYHILNQIPLGTLKWNIIIKGKIKIKDNGKILNKVDLPNFAFEGPEIKIPFLSGCIKEYGNEKVLENVKISMVDEIKGSFITYSDKFGNYRFDSVPCRWGHVILTAEKYGYYTDSTIGAGSGNYSDNTPQQFDLTLKNDSLILINKIDSIVRINIIGKLLHNTKKLPLINQQIKLLDADNIVLQITTTDKFGDFSFAGVDPNKKYYFELSENINQIVEKVFLAKQNGIVVGEFKKNTKDIFHFELLPMDIMKLGLLEAKDEPLANINEFIISQEKELFVSDNIYYYSNSAEITSQAKERLDKVVEILKANPNIFLELWAHTDSRGDEQANLELSEKRAHSAIQYMISMGIDNKRITGKGYGESKILNRCTEGVYCSEKEHELNRRTELKFIKK